MRPTFLITAACAAILAAPLALSGCVTDEPQGGAPMPLVNAAGATIGSVRAWQTTGGVTFRVEARGLAHGIHAIHAHSVGRCDPPDFVSAGPHWNPLGRKHGLSNPAGPHAGDLPNVTVAANGVMGDTVTLSRGEFDLGRDHGRFARRRRRRTGDPRRPGRQYDRPQRQQRRPHRLRGDPPGGGNPLTETDSDPKRQALRGFERVYITWIKMASLPSPC